MKKFILLSYLILHPFFVFGVADVHRSKLDKGAGSYEIDLGIEQSREVIDIFYYVPTNMSGDTSVIIVIPGAGRNAGDYRDSWVQHAEKYNLLVLSPSYPEEQYDFAAYHLGGIVKDLKLTNPTIEKSQGRITKYRMRDEDIQFSFNENKSDWIFDDFDKIFDSVKSRIGPKQVGYDLFGHSAGGQILHRHAIFSNESKVRRIVAANSGFYTLPDVSINFPFGVAGTPLSKKNRHSLYSNKLIVLLGEIDNEQEKRGTMLHTPFSDRQGLGRLERGKYFFDQSKKLARTSRVKFNWQLRVVKDVGHDYRKMGDAAAKLLYAD